MATAPPIKNQRRFHSRIQAEALKASVDFFAASAYTVVLHMAVFYFALSFTASVIGAVSGIGGGLLGAGYYKPAPPKLRLKF